MTGLLQNGEWSVAPLLGRRTQIKHHRRKGRVLTRPVTCAERGKPPAVSLAANSRGETKRPVRVAEAAETVKDAGKSEWRSVTGRIGDETIASPRKRSRLPAGGLLLESPRLSKPEGGGTIPVTRNVFASDGKSQSGGCSSMVELLVPNQVTRVRFPSPAPILGG